ncbi:MAG: 2,3-bisphosphoglycerate-independent phosphoglycerate mutase [bacterium]|nr:2,3-bisphosphoglycerate-independent phosphoglycerate mutase [bacterium]
MSNIKKENFPLVLLVLDGWGIWDQAKGNPIHDANMPLINSLFSKYPNILLSASGADVGLPNGQPGNSEAGHMNIGAGRVVEQDSTIISRSINNGTFFKNPAFLQAATHVEKHNSNIHIMGLLSDGFSPHADNDHILSLISFFIGKTKQQIYLHLFTDGRDSPQFAALKVMSQYNTIFNSSRVKVASIMGRFYAMDRKKDWHRTKLAYDVLVLGKGEKADDPVEAIDRAYNRRESDEFILPTVIVDKGKAIGPISDNDAVVFFNLRSDRARQLTKAFVQKDFEKKSGGVFIREKILKNTLFVALTDFGPDLKGVLTAYPGIDLSDTLPIALKNYRQLYIAETEKYAHVTYFFNGGYDHIVAGETRIEIPSKDVDSYAKAPEMSTIEICDYINKEIKDNSFDFIMANIASPDMIGHTGDFKAAVKALEVVDKSVGSLIKAVLAKKGTIIITSDHGNVEEMMNLKTNEIDTEHSSNPVPFIIVNHHNYKLAKKGKLANIAPTLLDILGIDKPVLMKAKSLIVK